jgi:hypothetical protein
VLKDAAPAAGRFNLHAEEPLVRYVLERECVHGGFCFYRLDEPNGSDTWFALSILHALHCPFRSEKTRQYLCRLQRSDGTFDSLYTAYYAIRSLRLMNGAPLRDAASFVHKHLNIFIFSADRLPPEVRSMFRRLRYLLELTDKLGLEMDPETTEDIIRFVLSFRQADGGFGHGRSSLSDTAETLRILRLLAYPVTDVKVCDFIRSCETPMTGFANLPGASLTCIETVHDGLLCATLVSHMPRYLNECVTFIRFCRNNRGGFSRNTCTGIATLENSFYAVHALRLTQMLKNNVA